MAWLTNWTYRKALVIDQTDDLGAGVSYQIKLLVGKSSGATGEQVDCGGLVADDFDDLRFTSSDGSTLLDYWLESVEVSGSSYLATVWIEVPMADDAADVTIYMYYSGTETAVSSGVDTFLFFDDFSSDTIASKWAGDTANASISGGILTLTATSAAWKYLYGQTVKSNNVAGRMSALIHAANYGMVGIGAAASSYVNSVWAYYSNGDGWQTFDATTANIWSSSAIENDAYHIFDFGRLLTGTDTVDAFYDNVQVGTDQTSRVGTSDYTIKFAAYTNANYVKANWVLLRNYTYTEPTWKSFGNVEAARAISDVVTLASNIIKSNKKSVSSAITLAETISKFAKKIAASSITLVDTLSKITKKILTSTITLVETLVKVYTEGGAFTQKVLDEAITLVEVKTNKILKVVSSSLNLTDMAIRSIKQIKADSITIADTLERLFGRVFSETVTLVESSIKSMTKTALEAIEILDTRQFLTRLYLEETLSLSETIVKAISKIESISLTLNDIIERLIEKSFASSLTLTETVQKSVQKTVSQTLTLVARALREWTHFGSSYMANLLKDTFYLEVNTIEADSTGGHTDNWDFSRTFKGRLSRLPIKEQIGNDKVTVYATHKLYCEYMTVTTADRIRLGTRYFDIITVENPRNWNKHLELLLLEVR